MNRAEILAEADRLTHGDRNETHGDPWVNHDRIARIWSVLLGVEVTPSQVALCMVGVKLSRLVETPNHVDSFVDGAAYMAIAGELALKGTKMTEHEIKLRFVQAILDSVTEHGRATNSLMGANRAYDAIKSAGLLIKGDNE